MQQSETSDSKSNTEQASDDVFKVPAPKPLKTLNQVKKIDENSTPDFKLPELLSQSLPPEGKYFIEILKNGSIIERCNIINSRYTFGRSRDCDFSLDHPSISRYHACLLWSDDNNFYLTDLDSVHGTFLNKEKLNSQCLNKLSPGNNIIKFGGSSRIFMLGTTEESQQDDNSFFEEIDYKNSTPREEEEGCDWGMRDFYYHDHDGESGEMIGSLAQVLSILERGSNEPSKNENVYKANSQKTMQQWFEREGYDFEYQIDHHNGHFKCTFRIPIEDQDVTISGTTSVKKKESIENACLKCCQVLDRAGILFPWQRQKPTKPQDGSSESEDEIIDETEQYKKKKARKEAIKSAKSKAPDIENFETLNEKWKELSSELQKLKAELVYVKLNEKNKTNEKIIEDESEDALDAFMEDMNANKGIHSSLHTKIQKSQLKMSIIEIEKKQRKLEKMIKIAKPSFTFPKLSFEESDSKPVYKQILKREFKSEKLSKDDLQKPKVSRQEIPNTEKLEPTKSLNSDDKPKFKMCLNKRSLQPSAAALILEDKEVKMPKQDIRRLLPSEDKQFGLILKKDKTSNQPKMNYLESEAYIEWVPPSGQTGDGRTSLNDKFGY